MSRDERQYAVLVDAENVSQNIYISFLTKLLITVLQHIDVFTVIGRAHAIMVGKKYYWIIRLHRFNNIVIPMGKIRPIVP